LPWSTLTCVKLLARGPFVESYFFFPSKKAADPIWAAAKTNRQEKSVMSEDPLGYSRLAQDVPG